jgi:hypothetical protein
MKTLTRERAIVKQRFEPRQAWLALTIAEAHIRAMSDRDHRRPEPEIIPPGTGDPSPWQDQRGENRNARVWAWSSDGRGAKRRYGRPGPLGLAAIFIGLAALGALGFFVFLGALALTLPVIAAVMLIGIVAGIWRRL